MNIKAARGQYTRLVRKYHQSCNRAFRDGLNHRRSSTHTRKYHKLVRKFKKIAEYMWRAGAYK